MAKQDRTNVDIVVVGAGVGGLAAARQLADQGLSVVVLEARDRVGGRLLSIAAGGIGLDLGATWFWPSEPRITKLIAAFGLPTYSQHISGDAMFDAPQGAQRLQGNPIDVPSGRFLDGAQGLAQALASELPTGVIRLNSPVSSVQATSGGIQANTPHGVFAAAHLVLAVPPALAVASIDFAPALPERLVALAERTPVWMGAITKIVARYAEPFWRQAGLAGAAISHVGPMREIHDMSGPSGEPAVLFGFVPAVTVGEPTVTADEVLRQLVTLFGPSAAYPEQLLIHDWRQEPYTSPPGVECLTDYQVFGHAAYATPTLGGRLHWASTETAATSPGHIEGALAAADRAANTIVQSQKRDEKQNIKRHEHT